MPIPLAQATATGRSDLPQIFSKVSRPTFARDQRDLRRGVQLAADRYGYEWPNSHNGI